MRKQRNKLEQEKKGTSQDASHRKIPILRSRRLFMIYLNEYVLQYV